MASSNGSEPELSREEAIAHIKDIICENNTVKPKNCGFEQEKEALYMAIKALEQEPKTGHWIGHREHCEMNNLRPSGLGSYFWCSECDCGIDSKNFSRVNYNYCPNCGAKMGGGTDATD